MREPAPPRRRAHFYWWTLANVVAACVAVLSWLLCLHVFGHPEIPRNYEILQRLGRAEPVPALSLQELPAGDRATPRSLFQQYAALPAGEIERLNRALMRNYLTGLQETGLHQYVEGRFEVLGTTRLGDGDFFQPGLRVRAAARVRPDEFSEPAPWPVTVDFLLPTAAADAARWFEPGTTLELAKVPHAALVLRVAQGVDGETPVVHLTLVPLALDSATLSPEQPLRLEVPSRLDPGAAFPAPPALAAATE